MKYVLGMTIFLVIFFENAGKYLCMYMYTWLDNLF